MGLTMGSGSRGSARRAGGGGVGGGFGSMVGDDEGRFGRGVLGGVAVEGDGVSCAARCCVLAGRWAAGLNSRVGATPAARGRFLMGDFCLVVGAAFLSTAFLRMFLAP